MFQKGSGLNFESMSTIDSIAHIIKGLVLGALGGLLIPVVLMSIVFGGPGFIKQLNDGTSVPVILTSLISIPFSALFTGLIEGGLLTTIEFGVVTGGFLAIVTLLIRQFVTKRTSALVCGVLALVIAIVVVLTNSNQITLSTGLAGVQVWVLAALYVLGCAWLGYKLREVSVA